ncbi:urease accessory protein [Arthrobacter alpinus]|uniref:Urease accessory protein UreD n=1 Tax=Arthrobacter alpinus TaxID=656366 RepID=A0A1H5IRT6_9MICC|nr:urease accessory protein UreD [Arthrobacter alpinus]SEE42188.1 urease accessory protein [Arthrobacter alpinus]
MTQTASISEGGPAFTPLPSGQSAAGGLGLPGAASGKPGSASVGRLGAPLKWAGTLSLSIDRREGRNIAVKQFHDGALRILRPHYLDDSGQVCYVMINPGGAFLGGDKYLIEVSLADGADLLLTTQSATKVYRTPGNRAEQHMRITLGAGARLELLPDPLIAYREATYGQVTQVELDPTASLVMAEVVTPGWSPDGELFRFDEIRMRNEISTSGRLMVLDNLLIRPGKGSPVDSSCFMREYTHLGSLLVVDARVEPGLADELHALMAPLDPDGQLGITLLDGPGLAVRALSHSSEALNEMLAAAVDLLRGRWYGQGPLNLRKY